jgi:subtilisin family serine protease
MVGVGRSDRNDNFAGGYGLNTINFVAPGINVRTTADGNTYTTTTGTSFASPLTAGVIALLYAIPCESFMNLVMSDPQLGADLVLNAMMTGVDQKPQLTNFFIAGGRINAKKSMDILMDETCNSCWTPALAPASSVEETSASVSFNLVDDASSYTFFYRLVGATNWTEMSVSSSPINLSDLTACTNYEYYINAICPEENSNNSAVLTFRTKGCGACIDMEYCENVTSENPSARFAIHSPSNLSTTITNYTVTDGWGASLDNGYAYGNLVLVNDGSASPELGCNALTNGAAISGNIAVAVRGTCNFSAKALSAQNAGATALVIINNQTQAPATLGAGVESANITIPVIMISQTQGASLLTALQNGQAVVGLLGRQNEWIQSIALQGESFVTGNNNGYTGPIETNLELSIGGAVDFTMTPGFAGQPLPEYTRIWLDVNQNGQFETNELVFDQGAPTVGVLTGSFTVPLNALGGLSRIRFQMAYQGFGASALPNNCGSYQSGETEDYCVTIKAANVSVDDYEQVVVNIYPNPTTGILNIVSNAGQVLNIQVMSLSGQVVAQHDMTSTSMALDMSGLADGVYMVYATTATGTVIQVQKLIVAK